MIKAMEPSAAWWPATSCNLFVSSSLLAMPRLFTRSCCMLTPVDVSPGSEAVAITLVMPAAARRSLRARVKRTLAALDRQYWSQALKPAASVPSRSSTFANFAWYRAPLDCDATRPMGLLRSSGRSSQARRKWLKEFTCMTASCPSSVTSRASSCPPPRPALRQSKSRRGNVSRMALPKPSTESKLRKSNVTLGTVTLAPGAPLLRADSAAACASSSMPGRAGTRTSKPMRASAFTT
mmetsp:Transcript_57963/g.160302  ORF Transcript_57963/g.160302 Transcript_57963/m.160302 type:complete len:237 (+) Transcript_57963:358-1068(+)